MKKVQIIIIMFATAMFCFNCNKEDTVAKEKPEPKPLKEPVELTAEAMPENGGMIVVTGKTNLPDETILKVNVKNKKLGIEASQNSIVKDGKYVTGHFGPKFGIKAGNYKINVLLTDIKKQAVDVRKVIGQNGEHLKGKLVEESSTENPQVEYSFNFSMGTKAEIKQAVKEHKKRVKICWKNLKSLIAHGRKMQKYRVPDDPEKLRICSEMMLEHQITAKALRKEAETLPVGFTPIKTAALKVLPCVSCGNSALEACDNASLALAEQD